MNRQETCQLLTAQINRLKDNENNLNNLLPDIRLLYGTQPGTRTPVMYQPGIVFLFSGHKIGYINERVFRYDTNEYLLLTVPLPFECETFATEAVPLAGIRLNVDILQLQELLMDIGEDELFRPMMAASGINSATLTDEILCAIERLLDGDGASTGCPYSGQTDYPRNPVSRAAGAGRWRIISAGEPSNTLQPDKPGA